jgi:coenzyme F420-dependent glucose-6-phosphate dehydrogenase
VLISYHASHEQFGPAELLALAAQAERAGFDAIFSSDHLQPWAREQGAAGFAWAWLGAAMQATERCAFGAITVPSGWRYQPVVLAQAIATLGLMFPNRLPWIAFGSGEAINECAVGADWPAKDERNARLKEGADIVRALLAGAKVTHRGRVSAVNAMLWSRPRQPAQIIGAATSEQTAVWLASWADGLLTTCHDLDQLERVIKAFREAGGEGKPIHVKVDVSWAESDELALVQAHAQWRYTMLGGGLNWDLSDPSHFERAARFIRPEDVREAVFVAADLDRLVARLLDIRKLGVTTVDVHNVGRNQSEFIAAFGRYALPKLRASA